MGLDKDRAAMVLDPVAFARERLGFEPDPRQAEVLRCGAPRLLLNCSRQWGKSTVTALMGVHRMWSRPGSLVLVTGPSERQAAEFVRKASEFVARLDVRPRGDGQNRRSILLPNGSRMVGVPSGEARVRGFSNVSLLVIDEAARASDELYRAMRPVLAVSRRRPVADEHAGGQARILLGRVDQRRAGVDSGVRAGDGVPSDFEGISRGRASQAYRRMVPAGVPVRVRAGLERAVRYGAGGRGVSRRF